MAVGYRTPEEIKELVNQDRSMKVLIMGMPRSGTMSLVAALKKLGYTPYDFADRITLSHHGLWTDALRAKYQGKGEPWGRKEFDRVFKGFDCVLDVPCTFFPGELAAAYPDALTILNTRAPGPWHRSMSQTLFRVFSWPSWPLLARLDPSFIGVWYNHCRLTWQIFCNNDYSAESCIPAYQRHYEHVREAVPKDRLLEWEVAEGWEPLCKFLGKEAPEEDFPRVNDTEFFVKAHGWLWGYGVVKAVMNLGIGTLAIGGTWYLYKTGLAASWLSRA
ncbi:MAG: hypothetical protein Q9203_006631 [Teloschistes exilis]